ncbi:hypothetical protein ACEQ8H_006139 [Pleosporales sp. CAS-2024a]
MDAAADHVDTEMLEPPHCAIIGCMVDLSRITRTICQKIYLPNLGISDMIALTNHIESQLDQWLEALPPAIRPFLQSRVLQRSSLSSARDAVWIKRQRLVLTIRYHNLKILLFSSLLTRSSHAERANVPGCPENVRKCLESAKQTIIVIYQTYEHNDFFQTWFYNATYTVFAASVILLYIAQGLATDDEIHSLYELVEMAIDILESMDESVVAIQAARLLRRAKEKTKCGEASEGAATHDNSGLSHATLDPDSVTPFYTDLEGQWTQLNHCWGSLGLLDGSGMDLDFTGHLGGPDLCNPMFLFSADQ